MIANCQGLIFRGCFLLVLVLLVVPVRVDAAQLWAIDSGSRASIDPIPIDLATGAPGARINVPTPTAHSGDDLASAPSREPNRLWAVRWNVNGSRLQSFNPFSAKLITNVLVDAPARVFGLAIDPADGTVYGNTDTNLYKINPATGVTTLVGPMITSRATAFDSLGRLLAINEVTNNLVSIDTSTGANTILAHLGSVIYSDIASDPQTGLLYGLASNGLRLINTTTGASTIIGSSQIRPAGLAFTNIPEPTTLAMMLLLSLATVSRGHRRAALVG
jgi:hypothetical protein